MKRRKLFLQVSLLLLIFIISSTGAFATTYIPDDDRDITAYSYGASVYGYMGATEYPNGAWVDVIGVKVTASVYRNGTYVGQSNSQDTSSPYSTEFSSTYASDSRSNSWSGDFVHSFKFSNGWMSIVSGTVSDSN